MAAALHAGGLGAGLRAGGSPGRGLSACIPLPRCPQDLAGTRGFPEQGLHLRAGAPHQVLRSSAPARAQGSDPAFGTCWRHTCWWSDAGSRRRCLWDWGALHPGPRARCRGWCGWWSLQYPGHFWKLRGPQNGALLEHRPGAHRAQPGQQPSLMAHSWRALAPRHPATRAAWCRAPLPALPHRGAGVTGNAGRSSLALGAHKGRVCSGQLLPS